MQSVMNWLRKVLPYNARVQLRAVGAICALRLKVRKIVIRGNRNAWSARQLQRVLESAVGIAAGAGGIDC